MRYILHNSKQTTKEKNMKFQFADLSGSKIRGECKQLNSPLRDSGKLQQTIEKDPSLEAVLGEFDFYEMIDPDNLELWTKFAVDHENNVLHSEKLPDFVQIGRDWKILEN